MKIVLIIDWFVYYTVELANALVKEHDVLLVTRDHAFEISSPEEPTTIDAFLDTVLDPRVKREKVRFRRGALANLKEVPRVLSVIKKFAPHIVHVQETADWRVLFLMKMFPKGKRVLTVHDVVSHPGETSRLFGAVRNAMRRSAAKIIVHGEHLKEILKKKYAGLSASVCVISHGVLSSYKKWDVAHVEEEGKTMLFFGRLTQYKGLDILLKAHGRVVKRIPEARLIIAGRGEALPDDTVSAVPVQNLEIHHRFILNSEVPRFFRRAAVVVLPYTEASQSGVVPMAYSFGKPVVATAVGSIPEAVKHGISGFVVPPGDPDALAEALIKLLSDDRARKAMGEKALEIAERELSWDAIARETTAFYRG